MKFTWVLVMVAFTWTHFADGTVMDQTSKGGRAGARLIMNVLNFPLDFGSTEKDFLIFFDGAGAIVNFAGTSQLQQNIKRQFHDVFSFIFDYKVFPTEITQYLPSATQGKVSQYINDMKEVVEKAERYVNATIEMKNVNTYKTQFVNKIEAINWRDKTDKLFSPSLYNEGPNLVVVISVQNGKEVELDTGRRQFVALVVQCAITDALYTKIKGPETKFTERKTFWQKKIQEVVKTLRLKDEYHIASSNDFAY